MLYGLLTGDELVEGPLDPTAAYAQERLAAVAATDSAIELDFIGEESVESQVDPLTLRSNTVVAPLSSLVAEPGSDKPTTEAIPKPGVYKIKEGDTLTTIAAQFDVSLPTVLWANSLSVRTPLRPGSNLVIPPTTGVLHTVRSGDTLGGIANKYDAQATEITDYNRIATDATLRIGQQIMIPDGVIPQQDAPQIVPRGTRLAGVEDGEPTPPPQPVNPNVAFQSPVDQAVVSQGFRYGHGGTDFARVGADRSKGNLPAIYATAAGTVEFAGWHGGFGYLAVINHGNGWRTSSAHLSKLYVVQDQSVAAGAAIGQMGSTGHSTGPHLHLEMHHNGARVNPCKVLVKIC